MTIINPNSISGISSITALNSTAAINLFKADGTSANIIAGVTTGSNFITGTSNVHSTGYECTNINASGIITATSMDMISTDAGSSAAPEFKLYRNSASPADADYLGQIKFAGESDTGVERNYAKITGKILDASNGTEDGILEFAHIKAGSQTITGRWRSDSLQLLNGTNLSVNGTATFESTVTLSGGNLVLGDSGSTSDDRIVLGADSDLQLYHDGTYNRIAANAQIFLQNKAATETYITGYENGAVELYYDNSKKLHTTSGGIQVEGSGIFNGPGGNTTTLQLKNATDTDGTKLGHSSNSNAGFIQVTESNAGFNLQVGGPHTANLRFQCLENSGDTQLVFGTEKALVAKLNGAVELYHDNVKKLETTTNGSRLYGAQQDLHGDVKFDNQTNSGMDLRWDESLNRLHFEQDNIKAVFGGSSDLEIYHDGSTNIINGLYHPIELRHQSEVHIKCVDDGAVELYHNNLKRLETTSTGIDISGTTDGVINLDTTDSRGTFIRYQQGGATKVWAGCGQGLSLGDVNDFGIRATNHIRMRSGSEEHGVLTSEGHFAAKGDAGSWVNNANPTNTLVHQFCNTGNGRWAMQIQQEHHNGMCLQLRIAGSGNQEAFQVYKYNSTASTRFRVLQNGNCANVNNSFGSLSDVSLKENIVDANSQWNDIKAIKVRNFNFKEDKDTKLLGVVAQELETVSPKLVWEDKEGLKGVSYSVLYMKAIKALQESMTRIETLEAEVAALKGS